MEMGKGEENGDICNSVNNKNKVKIKQKSKKQATKQKNPIFAHEFLEIHPTPRRPRIKQFVQRDTICGIWALIATNLGLNATSAINGKM